MEEDVEDFNDDSEPEYFFAEDEEEFDEQTLVEKEHWSRGQLDLFTRVTNVGDLFGLPIAWLFGPRGYVLMQRQTRCFRDA